MQQGLVSLGLAIRELRERRGLSQESLAEKAGVHRTYIGGVERGEYNISFENILKIAKALELSSSEILSFAETRGKGTSRAERAAVPSANLLEDWGISSSDLTQIVAENPSLRGFMLGYVAEHKLRQRISSLKDQGVELLGKPDDHDRTRKGDILVRFQTRVFRIELKSLQTSMVRKDGDDFLGKAQCDASDRRKVRLPNGKTVETTCLLVGEFDVLAINLYAFRKQWDFAFALNADLPRSRFKKYSKHIRSHLLATLVEVTWPVRPPFVTDLVGLLRRLSKAS